MEVIEIAEQVSYVHDDTNVRKGCLKEANHYCDSVISRSIRSSSAARRRVVRIDVEGMGSDDEAGPCVSVATIAERQGDVDEQGAQGVEPSEVGNGWDAGGAGVGVEGRTSAEARVGAGVEGVVGVALAFFGGLVSLPASDSAKAVLNLRFRGVGPWGLDTKRT